MIALLDNTVMSNFAVVQRPDLLRRAFGDTLATSQQAFAELKAGVRVGLLREEARRRGVSVPQLVRQTMDLCCRGSPGSCAGCRGPVPGGSPGCRLGNDEPRDRKSPSGGQSVVSHVFIDTSIPMYAEIRCLLGAPYLCAPAFYDPAGACCRLGDLRDQGLSFEKLFSIQRVETQAN